MSAPTFRQVAPNNSDVVGRTSMVAALPLPPVAGNLLAGVVIINGSPGLITLPPGFLVAASRSGALVTYLAYIYKVSVGAADQNPMVSWANNVPNGTVFHLAEYANIAAPIVPSNPGITWDNLNPVVWPPAAPVAGKRAVLLYAGLGDAGTQILPADVTQRVTGAPVISTASRLGDLLVDPTVPPYARNGGANPSVDYELGPVSFTGEAPDTGHGVFSRCW